MPFKLVKKKCHSNKELNNILQDYIDTKPFKVLLACGRGVIAFILVTVKRGLD